MPHIIIHIIMCVNLFAFKQSLGVRMLWIGVGMVLVLIFNLCGVLNSLVLWDYWMIGRLRAVIVA